MKVLYGLGVNLGLPVTCTKPIFLFIDRYKHLFVCFWSDVTKPSYVLFDHRKQISVPVRVQGLENVRLIAVGAFHNLALKEDGTLWAWGNNEYGQLGTGDTQPRSHPIPVQGLDDLTLVCGT